MGVWYTYRETVMSAQDIKAAAYNANDIDRAIETASRTAEQVVHRATIAPTLGTRYFDWPSSHINGWTLYLEDQPLISLTSLSAGGDPISGGNYFLEPVNSGPPYRRIVLNKGTSAYWTNSTTPQRAVAATGLWGWSDVAETVGTLAEDLDSSETGVDGSGMPEVGVGAVIRVGDERMIVTDKSWLSMSETVTVGAQNNLRTIAVTSGPAYVVGETLLIDGERVRVVDIAGNNLVVNRAVDGTPIAAHSGATVYALRTLTVQRGVLGTSAASHSTGAAVTRWVVPEPLGELTLAYAINILVQRQSGYARTVGAGEGQRESPGRGIREIEADARAVMGRVRVGAV